MQNLSLARANLVGNWIAFLGLEQVETQVKNRQHSFVENKTKALREEFEPLFEDLESISCARYAIRSNQETISSAQQKIQQFINAGTSSDSVKDSLKSAPSDSSNNSLPLVSGLDPV